MAEEEKRLNETDIQKDNDELRQQYQKLEEEIKEKYEMMEKSSKDKENFSLTVEDEWKQKLES